MHTDRMNPGQPSDVFLQLPDRRIRARWLGVSTVPPADRYAPTLVFLHEGLGSVELWRSFPEALCARTGLRGLAYDRTGYGQSSAWPSPPGVRYLEIEADVVLPQVLDAAGIEACLLIGHGDGGTIAMRFAAAQPPLLRGIVTIGAPAISEPRTVSSMRQAREAFLSTDLRAGLARYHGENVDGAFWLWNDAWLTPGFEPIDVPRQLPRVRVPVLALQGEHDEYSTVAQLHAVSRGVSGRCETRRMTGCGHAPHLQDEATLVEVVARFIATLWRGPAGDAARAVRALLFAVACVTCAPGVAAAQPDPCADAAAQAALADARRDLDHADDAGAAERLQRAVERVGRCHEVGLAALAVDGWVEARRLALVGGAPDALARMRDTLARIDTVRAARPPTALLSQLAAYADAVLRAAVAAAQDERDEMQVYLAHARTLADSLGLARVARPWPLPIDVAAGELWLEVDRFSDARDAFARVTDEGLAARVALGSGQVLERVSDQAGACTAYRRAALGGLAPAATERARLAVIRLKCPPR
jgi:pimeloyl-ACP methyl ester carboxylesterase